MLDLSEIVEATSGKLMNKSPAEVGGFSLDTRTLDSGDFFVALPGKETDGHEFLTEAFRKGASGALVSESEYVSGEYENLVLVEDTGAALREAAAFYREELDCKIVGITGSWGKTTTKEILASIFSEGGPTYRSPGNYNTEYGLPISLLRMRESSEYGVFELGLQYPGDIEQLASILKPDEAIVTGIGKVHLEHFPNQKKLLEEKMKLPRSLPENGTVVLNGDCSLLRGPELEGREPVYYGLKEGEDMDFPGRELKCLGLDGSTFLVEPGSDCRELKINLLGRGNVYNTLAATSMARSMGIEWSKIETGIEISPLPQRLNPIKFSRGVILDDSYNANPVSTRAALNFLSSIDVAGSKSAVLGDMLELGPSAEEDHASLAGDVRDSGIEGLYTLGNLTAEVSAELDSMETAPERVFHFDDRDELTNRLLIDLEGDDNAVLVKGSRGMKMEKIVQDLINYEV